MIYAELKKSFWSWKSSVEGVVMKERDFAGRVMLNIIFDILTTWDTPNVDNFFLLLRQFYFTFSNPELHDGKKRKWGIPYGREQVKLSV